MIWFMSRPKLYLNDLTISSNKIGKLAFLAFKKQKVWSNCVSCWISVLYFNGKTNSGFDVNNSWCFNFKSGKGCTKRDIGDNSLFYTLPLLRRSAIKLNVFSLTPALVGSCLLGIVDTGTCCLTDGGVTTGVSVTSTSLIGIKFDEF
jgi:hypothetical protein